MARKLLGFSALALLFSADVGLFYAPGFYTGYGLKMMPGAREIIEQKQYADAEKEIARVAKALDRETLLINAAAADLEKLK